MNVKEIREKIPEAELYELQPDRKYILIVEQGMVSQAAISAFLALTKNVGFDHLAVLAVNDVSEATRRLLEISGELPDTEVM